MKKAALAILALGLAAFTPVIQAQTQAKPPDPEAPKIKVGDTAPDFKLQYFDGQKLQTVSLHDYAGKKNVVLAFYVFAFTGG